MISKPPILDVIAARVNLQRVGGRLRGLCPFHTEKTPSFTVDEEKGRFYCFGCQAKGDVIAFVQKIDGLTFPEALARLRIQSDGYKPKPVDTRNGRAAAKLATWMNEQHLKVGVMLRELTQQIRIAEEIPDAELIESLSREWEVLSDLFDDLQRPECAAEFLAVKASIEAITEAAPVEPLPSFPSGRSNTVITWQHACLHWRQ
jgi:DNA primase